MLGRRLDRTAKRSNMPASKASLSYIVGTLCTFVKTREFFRILKTGTDEKLAFECLADLFFEAMNDSSISIGKFKRMGDVALVMSGPFRARVQRNAQFNYYCTMGSAAYLRLARLQPEYIYGELALMFQDFAGLLYNAWVLRQTYTEQDLLELYERWHITQDKILMQELLEQGFHRDAFIGGIKA